MNRRTILTALFTLPLAWLPKRGETKPLADHVWTEQEILHGLNSGTALARLAEADQVPPAQPLLLYPSGFEISPNAFQPPRPYECIVWTPMPERMPCCQCAQDPNRANDYHPFLGVLPCDACKMANRQNA